MSLLQKTFFEALNNIEYGQLKVTTPDDKEHFFEGKKQGEFADLHLKDWNVIRNMAIRGDTGLGEDYFNGKWDTSDLENLIKFSLRNEEALDKFIFGNYFFRTLSKLSYLFKRNSLKGSKRNIMAHYDLGNNFYKLWLDESMTYSSGIFSDDNDCLRKAQHNKYGRILNKFTNKPGKILEIGCGWGGFAEKAIEHDHHITGLTLSPAQLEYANSRLAKNKTHVDLKLEDYRKQDGKFDYITSIEMFEAVGKKYWPTYFKKVASALKEKGIAVIQTITVADKYFKEYCKGGDFIRTHIFPGGMLPSPSEFNKKAKESGLKIRDSFCFGKSYAITLRQWLKNFDNKIDEVKELGFDDRFVRLWRFYLASCAASFEVGRTDVMQVELSA